MKPSTGKRPIRRLCIERIAGNRRGQSTSVHFYQNRLLESYASKEATPLTLRQLQFYGKSMTEDRLIKSANYVRTELPIRIAHRLRDMQTLPYVVITQESVAKVYEIYWLAFERFRRFPPVTTLKENTEFCHFTQHLLNEHATVIPSLSLGLSLASPRLSPDQLDAFMRRMLISRISRRVLAEHHIALSTDFSKQSCAVHPGEAHIGIIYTHLKLRGRDSTLSSSPDSRHPPVIIDGHLDARFSYIREHLEYIIFELLKNSIHATQLLNPISKQLPPIRVTVVASSNDVTIRISDQGGGLLTANNPIVTPSDLFSFSHLRNAKRLEVSRLGALRSHSVHGMRATVEEQVNRWNQPSQDKPTSNDAERHIGIGLPMSNIYATYFGGALDIVSLDGWGTDVFVRLPKLGTNLEGIAL